MAVNDFNLIASVYDRLAHLVFRGNILKSQTHFLHRVKTAQKVLILGGGTGQLLEFMPACEHIDYIEKSDKMILQARKRTANSIINFINLDFLEVKLSEKYDVIICPFFLDCFGSRNLELILVKIEGLLSEKGTLIVSDFDFNRSNKLLVKLMHLLFKLTASIESRRLLDIRRQIDKLGFIKESLQHFPQGIFSAIYSKEQ